MILRNSLFQKIFLKDRAQKIGLSAPSDTGDDFDLSIHIYEISCFRYRLRLISITSSVDNLTYILYDFSIEIIHESTEKVNWVIADFI